MKKNIVKRIGVLLLAGVMVASFVGCGSKDSASNDASNVIASDGEMFESENLDAGQVKLLGKVYDLPVDYSKINKKFQLRDEMTQQFNVKVPAMGTLDSIYLDVYNRDNANILVSLKNTRGDDELPKNCQISSITAQTEYADKGVILLPGDISVGSTAYDITGTYGEPDTTIDKADGFTYVYEKGNNTYTFEFSRSVEGCAKIIIESK
ncbi:hypothetical protein SAMN02910369_00779 [Lachnospiraceae bacterium NE2001]|nr:hypothetical protein SAMN02910369_00779 [Lachnospiraceae bacterium NE2001]